MNGEDRAVKWSLVWEEEMLRLIANLIFGVGYGVGWVKYRMGIFVVIPEKYRW